MKRVHLLSTSFVLGALTLYAARAAAQERPEPLPPSAPAEPAPSPSPSIPETAPAPPAPERAAPRTAPPSATAAIAGTARPVAPVPPPLEPDRPAADGPSRYDLVRVNAGVRIGYVPSRGFDTYASNDVLAQFSIDATYPLFVRGKAVFAVGLGWDIGSRSDGVRGFESSLVAHRLSVPIEGRYHFAPWLYGFGKLAPGAAAMIVSVKDGTMPTPLSDTGWAFSGDASVGASILLTPTKRMDKRNVRLWVTPEIGYAFTTNASLSASHDRDEKDVLGSDENTKLRSLALSGLFWRASVGITF
jgi:hypothetical protein